MTLADAHFTWEMRRKNSDEVLPISGPVTKNDLLSLQCIGIASNIPANMILKLPADKYFKAGDSEALRAKLMEFSTKPHAEEDKNKQMKRIAEKYNWLTIANRTLGVYKKIFLN